MDAASSLPYTVNSQEHNTEGNMKGKFYILTDGHMESGNAVYMEPDQLEAAQSHANVVSGSNWWWAKVNVPELLDNPVLPAEQPGREAGHRERFLLEIVISHMVRMSELSPESDDLQDRDEDAGVKWNLTDAGHATEYLRRLQLCVGGPLPRIGG